MFISALPLLILSIIWITDIYATEEKIPITKKIFSWIVVISCLTSLIVFSSFNDYCNRCERYKQDAEILYYSGTTNAPNDNIQKNLDLIIIENIKKTTNK